MNTASKIFLRVAFVAMLVIGTACNKLDRSSLNENAAVDARGERTAEQAQSAEADRVRELQDRVAYLEAQLKDVQLLSAKADEPGGKYWD
jgi:hypothetical protein